MTLGKQVLEQLQTLASNPEAVRGYVIQPHARTLTVIRERQQAVLEFADCDRYSLALRELRLCLPARTGSTDGDYLRERTAELVQRLSYLEEPLAVWELEGTDGIAQLRSHPPLREDERITYWELTVHINTETERIALARYQWQPAAPDRTLLLYPATFALLARLTDSLI